MAAERRTGVAVHQAAAPALDDVRAIWGARGPVNVGSGPETVGADWQSRGVAKHEGRLELTWTDKDKALLSTGDGKYDYTFVDPSDRRVAEVRLLHEIDRIHADTPAERPADLPTPTTDNLLITGDAMHVLDAVKSLEVV